MPLPVPSQKSSSEETPPEGKRLRKITSASLNSLRRLCLWITCCWPGADHNPSVYPSTSAGSNPRGDWLPSPDVGENPSKEECLDRTLLPLSFLFCYLCCREKKGEVKETAQRLQDVLLHLSGNAGEWLTQNIWWLETIMFFFLFHVSSCKYQAFKLWNMVEAMVKQHLKAIWIQGKNKETLKTPKSGESHVTRICLPISESCATREQMVSSQSLAKVLPRTNSLTQIID